MRFLVVNGSPKGKYSITLQTVEYLKIVFPEHQFDVLHAGKKSVRWKRIFRRQFHCLKRRMRCCFPIRYIRLLPPASCIGLWNW